MKKLNTLFFFFFLSLRAIAQVTNTSIYSFEEIKPKSLKGELGLLLSTSFAQNDTYASFRSMFNSKFAYIAQKNDYRLNISNYISINDDGKLTYKNDFLFKLGLKNIIRMPQVFSEDGICTENLYLRFKIGVMPV